MSFTLCHLSTGELHLAAITSKYGLVLQNGFFLGACDLINDGLWDDKVGYNFTGGCGLWVCLYLTNLEMIYHNSRGSYGGGEDIPH